MHSIHLKLKQFLDDIELLVINQYTFPMYRMKQMAAIFTKHELDIKYHCYYSQMESLTYIPKRTHLNDILCNVVVISILLNRVLQTLFFKIWDMLTVIHCIMLLCNYHLAETSSTILLLMQNKLKNKKEISISKQLTWDHPLFDYDTPIMRQI